MATHPVFFGRVRRGWPESRSNGRFRVGTSLFGGYLVAKLSLSKLFPVAEALRGGGPVHILSFEYNYVIGFYWTQSLSSSRISGANARDSHR